MAQPSDSTTFSAELGQRCEHLFQAFWDHPFLAGMRDGTLPRECVLHYVGQDHQYLTAFMRCYGLGIAASPDREWVQWFHDNVAFLLGDETHPHHALCRAAGVSYEQAQVSRLAPSARAYINHMLEAGRDSLGVLLGALLPCPWTYIWAGTHFVTRTPPSQEHPFRDWWLFYGSPESQELLSQFRTRLDTLAADAGAAERRRMAEAFEESCHHEVRFWEMAWTLEEWTPPRGQRPVVSPERARLA